MDIDKQYRVSLATQVIQYDIKYAESSDYDCLL